MSVPPGLHRLAWGLVVVIAGLAFSFLGWLGAYLTAPDPPADEWGIYTTPVILGTRNGTDVRRALNAEGYPTVDSPQSLPSNAVRCGPPKTVFVTSSRSWEILGRGGDPIDVDAPSTLELPLNPGVGSDYSIDDPAFPACYAVSWGSVSVPAEVLEIADGRPISYTLTIRSDDYAPVSVSSEWFVIGDEQDAVDLFHLPVPEASPIRRHTDPQENP